jgi:branched-chain amino acid transport system ATP-binding protein
MLELEVNNVSKNFRGLQALKNVNFNIEKGRITGLIGPNGAGKTTLFNIISGFYKPSKGNIIFGGKDITNLTPFQRCELGIARTFQIPKPLNNVSVLDNVVVGFLFGRRHMNNVSKARENALELLEFTGLLEKKDFLAKELGSEGHKSLELTRALATDPILLLLDEVMAGLNSVEIQRFLELIKKINRDNNITILIIEHVMSAINKLSDKIVVLDYGEKIAEDIPEKIVNNKLVMKVYLGEEKQDA